MATAAVLFAAGGCGDPQEEIESNPAGVNGQSGQIQLRGVRIAAPQGPRYSPGADADVWLTLINDGRDADTLTAVSSPVAERMEIRWDSNCDGTTETVPSLRLPAGAPPDPGPVATSEPSGAPPFDAYNLRLVSFNREVLAGTNVPITFTFAVAPPVTLDVPVRPRQDQADPGSSCAGSPRTSPTG